MKTKQTYEETMLEKHPNMYKPRNCHMCKADLRYLNRIHRIYNLLGKRQLNWYCDKCYKNK